jgi:AraC-like DNA-binding protein
MKNWKVAPKEPAIAQYIDCYWFLEKSQGDIGPEHPKLNPDPAAHIIIASSEQPYHYEYENYLATGMGSHLILPYGKTYTLDHSQPFTVIGIKLKVGVLYSLPLVAIHPLLNEIMPLNLQQQLHISVSAEASLLSRFEDEKLRDQLDQLLQPLIAVAKEDKHSVLVRKTLALFQKADLADISLSDIGNKLGCSQRTIERSFSKVTGFTLKQYHTMQRLEAMLEHLHTLPSQDINWTDIALSFGFCDQPHLIRYVKTTMGSTPGQYAEARDLAIDAYGNFE